MPDCIIKKLPSELHIEAARTAVRINPANAPIVTGLPAHMAFLVDDPAHAALLTGKYWGAGGVKLTVGFLETTALGLRARIVKEMNAWSEWARVEFMESSTDPDVRISRGQGGYWSYLGTDIKHVDGPTMNLEGFVNATPQSEFVRVVRHETGHTLGLMHEHQRQEVIDLLDREKTIAYFMASQGWSREEVIQQVLTPPVPGSIMATAAADQRSIMCYEIAGQCTKSGQPIPGGNDIDDLDKVFIAKMYPKPSAPIVTPPGEDRVPSVISIFDQHSAVLASYPLGKRIV